MQRTTLEAQLMLVERGIAECKADAVQARKRVIELRRSGRDTRYAEEMLAHFLVTHSVLEARREIILVGLADSDAMAESGQGGSGERR